MLPPVSLRTAGGGRVRIDEYRHRKHVVVILFPDPPGTYEIRVLRLLTSRYQDFLEENAVVLAVFPAIPRAPPDPSAPDPCPFPILADRDGMLSDALSDRRASGLRSLTVHVADRYGEIFRSLDVAVGDPFPLEEVLSWLRFLERLCPE
jgi:peroxiredoxin